MEIKMAIYNPTVKLCATCSYWGGNRIAANSGNNSEVNNGENGICNFPKKKGTQARENYSCQFWAKWPALR